MAKAPSLQAANRWRNSVRFAHSGPSHNLLRPAGAELVSCGPLPLPVSGGGHVRQRLLPERLLRLDESIEKIAILLTIKGIAIVFLINNCYLVVAKKRIGHMWLVRNEHIFSRLRPYFLKKQTKQLRKIKTFRTLFYLY